MTAVSNLTVQYRKALTLKLLELKWLSLECGSAMVQLNMQFCTKDASLLSDNIFLTNSKEILKGFN